MARSFIILAFATLFLCACSSQAQSGGRNDDIKQTLTSSHSLGNSLPVQNFQSEKPVKEVVPASISVDEVIMQSSPYYQIVSRQVDEFSFEYTYSIFNRQHDVVWHETETRAAGRVEFSLKDDRLVEYHFSLINREIIRNFSPIANLNDIVTMAEFLDNEILKITYLSGAYYTEVMETIDLNDCISGVIKNGNTFHAPYSNPIDDYFLPRIEYPRAEVGRRAYQDTYRGVWKSEFENIVKWTAARYTYQQDLDALSDYVRGVEQLIENARALMIAELRAEFDIPPGAPEFAPWGNGTRSWLNQVEGEIYRDAGMRLIESMSCGYNYTFLDVDYSKECYE